MAFAAEPEPEALQRQSSLLKASAAHRGSRKSRRASLSASLAEASLAEASTVVRERGVTEVDANERMRIWAQLEGSEESDFVHNSREGASMHAVSSLSDADGARAEARASRKSMIAVPVPGSPGPARGKKTTKSLKWAGSVVR